MATRKKAKSFGMYKVEEIPEQVLVTGNGLKVALQYDPVLKTNLKSVRITDSRQVETKIDAITLVQVADAVRNVDKKLTFVCGFHGTFIAPGHSRQPPTCPGCLKGVVDTARDMSGALDDEDA